MASLSIHSTAFVHDSAVVDEGAVLDAHVKVWHFSHVMSGAVEIGRAHV